jgi:protocatechuate 3,4-dioxygenase beta subunit
MAPSNQDIFSRALRRREALIAFAATAGGVLWQAACGNAGPSGTTSSAAETTAAGTVAADVCVLSPEVTEGPYWIANHLTRRDITDGRPGIPLALRVTVVDADTCKPIRGADVEIWHADALGVYSGFSGNVPPSGGGGHATPNNSKRFLRGHQRSDANGHVLFDTVYPGWYRGRTPHIHMKVNVGGSVVHTGQLFFPDATSDAVYRTSAYRSHGQPDTTNGADGIYAAAGGSKAKVHLTRRHKRGGYKGRITVGVRA